jgi:hypothetical protein
MNQVMEGRWARWRTAHTMPNPENRVIPSTVEKAVFVALHLRK